MKGKEEGRGRGGRGSRGGKRREVVVVIIEIEVGIKINKKLILQQISNRYTIDTTEQ